MRRWLIIATLLFAPLARAQSYGRYQTCQLQTALGQAVAGAQVYFLTQPANTSALTPQATVYANPDGGGGPVTQPLRTNGFGECAAYLAPGVYTVVYISPITGTLVYPDQNISVGGGSPSSPAFGSITSGTNTLPSSMTVGNGSIMSTAGTGRIKATDIDGVQVTGTPGTGQAIVATSPTAATWQTPSGGVTQLTSDVVAGPGSGSLSATVKGLNGIPFCAGFSPSNTQSVTLTTSSSPNPCWTGLTASGSVTGQANNVVGLATSSTAIGAQSHINENTPGTTQVTQTLAATGGLVSGTPTTAALAALPSGAHGTAGDESSTAGVPAAGVDYWRWDSTSHCAKGSFNGTAESCAATVLTFATPPPVGNGTPAASVQSKASAIQPTSVSDCSFNGARYGVDFGGLCSLAEMADTNWIPNATDINGVAKELVSAGAGGGSWAGPGSNYAEYKTNSAMPTLLDIGDSSLVNGTPVFGAKNGGGDIFAKGYSYFGERGGTPFSADEGAGVDAAWFGELGPMSATVDASSSGQVIVPNSPSCTWNLPGVQSCQPAKDSRMVDLTTSITGRFTSAPATASISGCSLVTWIEAISTSASIPAMSVYGCTATADVLGFQATVSGSTLTQTAGQPFDSSWNGAQAILNQNQHGTLSACNSTTCTMTPSPGLSGSVNGGLQVLGTNPVLNSITFTGGAGSFAPGDFVCVIGHANSDFGGFPGIIEQSTVVSATGSAGAQTITLNLAKPNGQVFVLKGGCGFVSLDANMYGGYDSTAGYTPGYVALDQSTDGSTMLLVSEAYGGTGTFTIPAGAGEAGKAAVNPAFQATHAYSQGDLIFDGTTNCGGAGCVWSVTAAGTSGGSAPAWTDFPSSIAVGAATAYNVGPATLFHLYPNAARVVSNNYVSHSLPNNVTTQVYASSTLEPFASGAFASGDAIRDPNYDAQTLTAHKTTQQCLSGAAESNCDPLLVTMVGPGAVGGGANTNAGVTLLNNNPLGTYYANGSLANPQIRLPPDAFHIGGAGQPGVHYNTFSLASPPVGALFDITQPLTGQSSYALLTQHGWNGAITLKNGEMDFDNFTALKRGSNTICDSGGGIPGCGTFSGTVSANTIPRMNSGGTALENSDCTNSGSVNCGVQIGAVGAGGNDAFVGTITNNNFGGVNLDQSGAGGHSISWWARGTAVGSLAGENEMIDHTAGQYAMFAWDALTLNSFGGHLRMNKTLWDCFSSGDPGGSQCDRGFSSDASVAGQIDVDTSALNDKLGGIAAANGVFGASLKVAGNDVCQSTGTNCPAASAHGQYYWSFPSYGADGTGLPVSAVYYLPNGLSSVAAAATGRFDGTCTSYPVMTILDLGTSASSTSGTTLLTLTFTTSGVVTTSGTVTVASGHYLGISTTDSIACSVQNDLDVTMTY